MLSKATLTAVLLAMAALPVTSAAAQIDGMGRPLVLAADGQDSAFCKHFPKWCSKDNVPGGNQNTEDQGASGGAMRAPAGDMPTRGIRAPSGSAPASPSTSAVKPAPGPAPVPATPPQPPTR